MLTTSASLSLTSSSALIPATHASECGSTSQWRTSARHRSAYCYPVVCKQRSEKSGIFPSAELWSRKKVSIIQYCFKSVPYQKLNLEWIIWYSSRKTFLWWSSPLNLNDWRQKVGSFCTDAVFLHVSQCIRQLFTQNWAPVCCFLPHFLSHPLSLTLSPVIGWQRRSHATEIHFTLNVASRGCRLPVKCLEAVKTTANLATPPFGFADSFTICWAESNSKALKGNSQ